MTVNEYIDLELPSNLTLDTKWVQGKKKYWELFMNPGFESIPKELRCENFEDMCNSLIAKLVVYDAFQMAAMGSFIAFIGGGNNSKDQSTEVDPESAPDGGNIKSITTGPTKVEFYSTSTALKDLLSSQGENGSVMDVLFAGICSLASRIGIKVPYCDDNRSLYNKRFRVSGPRIQKFTGNRRRFHGLRRY